MTPQSRTVVIDDPEGLRYVRLASAKGRLELEAKGLRFKGPRTRTIIKSWPNEDFPTTGPLQNTIDALQAEMERIMEQRQGRPIRP